MSARTPVPSPSASGDRAEPQGPGPAGPGHPSRDFGRLLIGLIVIVLGALYALDTADVLDAGRAIDRWWPVAIVAAGALSLVERPAARVRGAILTGAGVLLLLFTTDVLGDDAWGYVWPAVLILVGLAIVARWRGRAMPKGAIDDEVMRTTAVFGGSELVNATPRLRGAWLTAVFGGITLDLRGARPGPDGASVNATAVLGGIDILVPRGWRITVRSTPILGGFEDKTDHSAAVAPDAPSLHIDALSILGGVSVKHEK